ncbi:DNA invertase Pin-like site-specific DNA recombinase [Nitrosospira multiformis]|uniref:DNA invertase Pin-like site-specific DNA recombinase n=1 Tax=Nitrosospira multiformis TaxID=1231 RepID=A0A2T5IH60_9PROT|nr:recombinase family protein [Nitrosospira multiformis]PTQ83158.1 DNA invertase Pin-like site-specific DNA recombinase [Nitrosospira multiformis]
MKIGYARVSTDDQNLDLQLDALGRAGCERIFTDQGVSGATIEREGLSQAIAAVGKGDVLVVWKLDRLGRSLSFLISLIEKLRNEGAGFESLSDGIDTTTTGGKLVFHIMGALAEFERSLISERSKAGMQAARRRGKHVGRPLKLSREQIHHASQMVREGRETVSGMAGLLNVDRGTLRRALKRDKYSL